jgi:hypothetical protein
VPNAVPERPVGPALLKSAWRWARFLTRSGGNPYPTVGHCKENVPVGPPGVRAGHSSLQLSSRGAGGARRAPGAGRRARSGCSVARLKPRSDEARALSHPHSPTTALPRMPASWRSRNSDAGMDAWSLGRVGVTWPPRWCPDGGPTCQDDSEPALVFDLDAVSCSSALNCVAVGNELLGTNSPFSVLTTSDGGQAWQGRKVSVRAYYWYRVSCSGATTWTAVGESTTGYAVAMYSQNTGATWSGADLPGADLPVLSSVACYTAWCSLGTAEPTCWASVPGGRFLPDANDLVCPRR